MVGEVGGHAAISAGDFGQYVIGIDWSAIFANKIARAVGMLVIVWVTIWVIALVYSGYARDSDLGPIAIRPHTNKKLGERTIVFDQTIYPFQMHGVEATCTFYYVYDDGQKPTRRRKIPLLAKQHLQLHIRSSPIPSETSTTRYGYEGPDELNSGLVVFPVFDPPSPPETVSTTPETIGEVVKQYGLIEKWTEDDAAPVVSLGASIWEQVCDDRINHIKERAKALEQARTGNILQKMTATQVAKDRANVFGSYYVKMQFSKHPWFVLFRHPNQDLKMTAWVTVLTSVFALAMDAWPVK